MGLLELLQEVKKAVGHGWVRWDTDPNGEIRIYTGLTARDESDKVMPELFVNLRQTEATKAFMEMAGE